MNTDNNKNRDFNLYLVESENKTKLDQTHDQQEIKQKGIQTRSKRQRKSQRVKAKSQKSKEGSAIKTQAWCQIKYKPETILSG